MSLLPSLVLLAAGAISMMSLLLTGCAAGAHPTPTSQTVSRLGCPAVPAEPSAEPPKADSVASDEVIAYTELSAMSEDQFWREISTMPRAASDSDFDALSRRLEPCGLRTLVAFDARLTLLLYHLDTAAPCLWYSKYGGIPGPVYSDDFLYARADTVLGGAARYRTAVKTGALRWGPSEQGEGELLLYVAQTAADDINKTDALEAAEERDIPLSYESGTNPASANPGDIQTACTPAS